MISLERITLYGERGIVLGLVLDIAHDLSVTRRMLRAIAWCSSADASWIGKVVGVHFLVEPHFGNFGQPDLVVICHLEGDFMSKRFVFVEAKAQSYKRAAKLNNLGMVKGFNSSINGQLSLDYRFACALSLRKGAGAAVVESREMFEKYSLALKETNRVPRRFRKGLSLRMIVDQWLGDLTLEQCLFVALTHDTNVNPIQSAPDDTKPLFLDQSGSTVWQALSTQVGCLSLRKLVEIVASDGFMRAALKAFVGHRRRDTRHEGFEGRSVPLLNWDVFPDAFVSASARLSTQIEKLVVPRAKLVPWPGSFSFIVNGKTVGKLVPENPDLPTLLVGFSHVDDGARTFAAQLGEAEACRYGPKWEPFLMVPTDPVLQAPEIVEIMVAFLLHTAGRPSPAASPPSTDSG